MALGGGYLLVAGTSFAAPDSGGTPQSVAVAQSDHECEALLLKVEKQISDGHTATPPNDNALLTWQSVIERVEGVSPGTHQALGDFVERVTTREAEERAAGRETVELDLKLFAGLAHELLARRSPSSAQALAAKPAVATDTPAITVTHTTVAVRAVPDTGIADTARRSTDASTTEDRAMAASFTQRGDAMLAVMDISAARKFYEFAADAGSAAAAMALARTFDPAYLPTLRVVGLKPDPASAMLWYHKAAALGDPDAEAMLRTLARSVN
jgi:hypothetical protein